MIVSSIDADLTKYVDAVTSGDIIAGEIVRGTVKRFQNDLAKETSDDFPYYFDSNAAGAVCDFFPNVLRHSIGDMAGMPFHLQGWQKFIIANLFGWKRADDDTRRFRRAFVSLGRKNGKSTFAAGLALFMAAMDINPVTKTPESVALVFLSATKKEQAAVIYDEIIRMVGQSPLLAARSREKYHSLEFSHNKGRIKCLGSDRPFHGLNPHFICMDELHNWTHNHRDFYDSMLTGSGNRSQGLILSITTAGDDKSYIWLEEYKYTKRIAKQEIRDDSFFGLSFEIDPTDDPLDERNWEKANPNLGVSIKPDFLRGQARQAAESSLNLNRFTRYHMNRLVTSTETAFDIRHWDKCKGELSDWKTAECITAGVDLGGRDDLAAYSLVARWPIEGATDNLFRYEVRTQSFIAQDTTRDLSRQPWPEWVTRELIKMSRHPIESLQEELYEQCRAFGVVAMAYDPQGGQHFAESMEKRGIRIASMAQTTFHFHEPITDFKDLMRAGRIRHDGNPLLRWCLTNAVAAADRQDRWMLAKRDSGDKIDPVIALLMALRQAMIAPRRSQGPLVCF